MTRWLPVGRADCVKSVPISNLPPVEGRLRVSGEFLYSRCDTVITVVLFALLLLSVEFGYRLGTAERRTRRRDEISGWDHPRGDPPDTWPPPRIQLHDGCLAVRGPQGDGDPRGQRNRDRRPAGSRWCQCNRGHGRRIYLVAVAPGELPFFSPPDWPSLACEFLPPGGRFLVVPLGGGRTDGQRLPEVLGVRNRSSGAFARQRRTTRSRSPSTSGRSCDGGTTGSWTCAFITRVGLSPSNGGRPVSKW